MGVSISRYSELAGNEYLTRFCSDESISPNDPFWNKLLSFNIIPPKSSDEQLFLDSSTERLLYKLLETNARTGNLGSLVRVFITRASELLAAPSTDNAMLAWQTFNALFVIRTVSKYLIETIPEYQLCKHFDVAVPMPVARLNASDEQLNGNSSPEKAKEASENPETSPSHANQPSTISPTPNENEAKKPNNGTTENTSGDAMEKPNVITTENHGNGAMEDPIGGTLGNGEGLVMDKCEVWTSPKLNLMESKLEMLIDALVGLIIDVPVTDNTYYLHLECIDTLLVLMSVYMFAHVHGQTRHIESSLIFRTLFQGRYSMHAPMLVKTLLQNFSSMYVAPEHMFGVGAAKGSLVLGLASGIWSILTFSSGAKHQSILTHPPQDQTELQQRLAQEHPVANQSCLLLLALTNHCCSSNLYRKALFTCADTADPVPTTPQKNGNGSGGIDITPPRIEMSALHRALCVTAGCEHSTLLLYLMLHACKAYKRHVCTVANIENLMLPILRSLYAAPDSNSHHIYMSLIIILILSEDDALTKSLHNIMIKNLTWYTERTISEISLGGLTVLVILRTVQYNILRVRDKYLHTNCLAALANMSGEFRNLHPYVAQRLVSLFEILFKRKARLEEKMDGNMSEVNDVNGMDVSKFHGEDKADALWESVCVLDEVLRMLLEILNSCLSSQLQSNLNLVYALLYKKQLFSQQAHGAELQDMLQNIEMVVGFFSSRLQRVQDHAGGDLGVAEVLATIRRGAEQWSSDRLKKFPSLKFRYVEEDRPEEFFTPYVWSLVGSCGGVFWASEASARAHRDLVDC